MVRIGNDDLFLLGATRAAALAAAAAIALSGCLSGCATMVSGGTDHVTIDSEPPGQDFQVYQGGASVGSGVTPQTIAVERNSSGLLVICGGSREWVESGFNSWTLGNLLLFPPVGTAAGWIIDALSGASAGYDDVKVEAKKG